MSDLQKVSPGQALQIPAAAYNAFVDAALATRAVDGGAGETGAGMANPGAAGVVMIRNNSGGDLAQCGILGIDEPLYTPDSAKPNTILEPVYKGVKPKDPEHRGAFAISLAGIKSGETGPAILAGVAVVKIKGDGEASTIRMADVEDEQTGYLVPSGGGVQVLWIAGAVEPVGEEEAPPRWAIVRIGGGGGGVLFPAKITSASSGAHAWTEQRSNTSGGFGDLTGGRTGTTTKDAAYEVNGRSEVPADTIVWIMPVSASDGTMTYLFDLGMGNTGTAQSMTYSGEHVDAADATTWDINDQATSRGLSLTVQTGSRYDHAAATPILYAYMRTLTFDANGHLIAIGSEGRVAIDNPDSCP